MKVHIVVARADHRHGIAAVANDALSASIDVESPRVRRVLSGGNTFVAIADDEVAGFVSNFATRDAPGGSRFELDLLAVAPAWQGQGIGGRLVARSLLVASESGASTARALVRCENKPMQSICCRHGFQRSADVYQLFVSEERPAVYPAARANQAWIIPVETLTYSGYWLEGGISQSSIDAIRQLLRTHRERAVTGAVVPQSYRTTIDLLRSNSFEPIGEFDWWTLRL